jgi:ribose 5-phosphate isomerase
MLSSERTKEQALSLGIPLCTLNEKSRLDVLIIKNTQIPICIDISKQ